MPTDARRSTGRAGLAFAGLLLFIAVVYANPGNWFDALADVGFAKIAAGLSLAALAGSWLLYNRRLTVGGIEGWLLLALFGLVGLSASWSFWPKYTVDTFLDGLKYLAIFILLVNTVDTRARLATAVRVMALASVIPAFGAIWSHAHGEHLVEGDRAGWIGMFGNPNDLAYHLVVGIAFVLAASAGPATRARRTAWRLLLAPLGYAILLTQSRGGMLAACAVVLLWLLRSVRQAPLILGSAITIGCLVFVSPSNPWRQRTASATAYGEDVSARGRLDAWRTGINMVKDRPLTGVGAGAFMIAWPEYAPGDAGSVRSEHNTFIQLVAELGIPALLLFVTALAAGALGVSRAGRVRDEGGAGGRRRRRLAFAGAAASGGAPIAPFAHASSAIDGARQHDQGARSHDDLVRPHAVASRSHNEGAGSHDDPARSHASAARSHDHAPNSHDEGAGSHDYASRSNLDAANSRDEAPGSHDYASRSSTGAARSHEEAAGSHDGASRSNLGAARSNLGAARSNLDERSTDEHARAGDSGERSRDDGVHSSDDHARSSGRGAGSNDRYARPGDRDESAPASGDARARAATWIRALGTDGKRGAARAAGAASRLTTDEGLPLAPYARGVQCGLAGFAVCSIWGGIAWTWPLYLLLGLSVAIRRLAAPAATANMVQLHNNLPTPAPALAARG